MSYNPLTIWLQPVAKWVPIRSHDIPVVPPMKRGRTTREALHFLPPLARRTRVSTLRLTISRLNRIQGVWESRPHLTLPKPPPHQPLFCSLITDHFFNPLPLHFSISAFQNFSFYPFASHRHRHHPNAHPALRQQCEAAKIDTGKTNSSRLHSYDYDSASNLNEKSNC